jgi:hypothetical protein
MSKKLLYESPSAELILVRFEENILSFDKDNNTETLTDDGDEDL